MLSAYLYKTSSPKQIVVLADSDNSDKKEVLKYLETNYLPDTILVSVNKDQLLESEEILPILKGKKSDKPIAIFIWHKL